MFITYKRTNKPNINFKKKKKKKKMSKKRLNVHFQLFCVELFILVPGLFIVSFLMVHA